MLNRLSSAEAEAEAGQLQCRDGLDDHSQRGVSDWDVSREGNRCYKKNPAEAGSVMRSAVNTQTCVLRRLNPSPASPSAKRTREAGSGTD